MFNNMHFKSNLQSNTEEYKNQNSPAVESDVLPVVVLVVCETPFIKF